MENNKKIIVGAVGCVITGILVFYFSSMSAKPTTSNLPFSGLDFDTPELDEKKFDLSNKKELYDKNNDFNNSKYDSLAVDLNFLQNKKEKIDIGDKLRYKRKDTASSSKSNLSKSKSNSRNEVNKDLQMLMDIQKQLSNANAIQTPAEGQYIQQQIVKEEVEKEVEKKPIPNENNYFFGASSKTKTAGEDLIPAEIIDQGILKAGSTVAIRTKQPIIFKEKNIRIPKGAVMYANVTFEETRLILNITKYRRDNKLYPVELNVHDFDGRIGIHLKSRTLFNIPLNVSEDVYDAAVSTYQQQSSLLSSSDPVPLEQIAALSAAKEASNELFDNRRVFVPRKYHLWITIKTDDEQ